MAKRRFSALTDRKKKRSIFRNRLSKSGLFTFSSILIVFLLSLAVHSAMVDRTVAIIGDDTITYRQVERRFVISRLSEGIKVPIFGKKLSDKQFNEARTYVIRVIIVNNHLRRIALKSPVKDEETKAALKKLQKIVGSEQKFAQFCKFYEISDGEVTNFIKEKLTVDDFFKKSAAGVEKVSEAETMAYYEKEKENKFYGKSFEELKDHIKQYLLNLKVARRNDEWVEGQVKKHSVRLLD